jgi:uncharacterized protein (TIGR00369 family)
MLGHETILRQLAGKIQAPPGVQLRLPPPAFIELQARYERYELRKELEVSFPVQEKHLNPAGRLQGGFLAAGIDAAMGSLSYLSSGRATTTLDLHINYLRGAYPDERLTIVARIVGRGFNTILIEAEVHDEKQKLVATATSQVYILKSGE